MKQANAPVLAGAFCFLRSADRDTLLGAARLGRQALWEIAPPAQGVEFGEEAGEGEADDVEVAAFDAGNEAAGVALDGVGAGFIERFVGGEIAE